MKCPKCGYVSYPGLAQCKKCGHRFRPEPGKETSGRLLSLFSGSAVPSPRDSTPDAPPTPATSASTASQPLIHKQASSPEPPSEVAPHTEEMPETEAPLEATQPSPLPDNLDPGSAPEIVSAPDLVRPWREELSERVENFRRRRARLREPPEPDPNPGFDFRAPGETRTGTVSTGSEPASESTYALDLTLETPDSGEIDAPILDALPLDARSERDTSFRTGSRRAFEERQLPWGRPGESLTMPPASLGRRFLAGLADTLILLLAVALFGLVFWHAGGHISLRPLNLLVLGFIAVLFILVYFGVFTALTSSTPGLLWMGLEIRNFEGEHATPREAAWRAFGYLVSMAGLMLGFIWALVDTDGLTWHDRISGTFLAVTHRESE